MSPLRWKYFPSDLEALVVLFFERWSSSSTRLSGACRSREVFAAAEEGLRIVVFWGGWNWVNLARFSWFELKTL